MQISRTLIFAVLASVTWGVASAQDTAPDETGRILRAERVIAGQGCVACDLAGADFSLQDLAGRDLTSADLSKADFSLAQLDRAALAGADLTGARMKGAKLGLANLSGADLSGADLSGAWLGSASVDDAVLAHTDLSGAWIYNAKGLSQAQLDEACGDDKTVLPEGLHLQACGGR